MTEQNEGDVRPAVNRPAAADTVTQPACMTRAKRMTAYRARQRAVARIALDRHIEHVYGAEYVRGWAA